MKKTKVRIANIEINREWLFLTEESKATDEASHERDFVISQDYLGKIYKEMFASKYSSLDAFLEEYVPEDDGEAIYQRALKDGEMKDEDICLTDELLAIYEEVEIIVPTSEDFNLCESAATETWVRLSEIQKMTEMGALTVNPDKMEEYHEDTRKKNIE